MTKQKKQKHVSIDLITLMELEIEAMNEKNFFTSLLEDSLAEHHHDSDLIEMICDGYSIANKLLRELDLIINSNPIVTPEEKETEQVVLFPEDQKIIEAIIMTRSVLRKEMRQKKNISFFLH
tara:strand:+ start:253 stop:618 length:366 start_codon:yes stop_codon:yes gene_type:complete